ncbi:MAG: aminotransferase class III-fold pyridoxal phosphate-dependent enzyme [Candidatus Omnitrophica bacterium]|nr:aminotransferase class III-fold pyridoxal phosphate-dependent enzyme [Candidatus Omnitrophota bacterium]
MAEVVSSQPSTPNSKLFSEAKRCLVGGVNSPVRSFKDVGGEPIFIKSAKGSRIFSEDGREFIDYCMAFGPLILGHSHPEVVSALEAAIKNGAVFGAVSKAEMELAKTINGAIPSIERIRFTNSGTEAVMTAIRLARAYTRKNKIIRFEGSYHGMSEEVTRHALSAPYNDLEKVGRIAEKYKGEIAAIIVEPVAGNMGVVTPKKGFLKGLREISKKEKIALIFDEVITGFRLCYGGAQNFFGIAPDLTCLGKIIGGGLPAGAVGGRNDIMKLLAPEGKVYQAGTFSGNPLTMTAGLATLKILSKDPPYKMLEERTKRLCEGISEINFTGSMFSIKCKAFKELYHALLEEGIYLAPSSEETNFVSAAHTAEDTEKTLRTFKKVFKTCLSASRLERGKK